MQGADFGIVDEYAKRFSDALVSEIKAEMGRRNLSSRKLGELIGESSQYMSMRLDGGNPRTGERVTLNVRDVAAIASALNLRPNDLTFRAHFLALGGDPNAIPQTDDNTATQGGSLIEGRFGVGSTQEDLDAVARRRDPDTGEDDQ